MNCQNRDLSRCVVVITFVFMIGVILGPNFEVNAVYSVYMNEKPFLTNLALPGSLSFNMLYRLDLKTTIGTTLLFHTDKIHHCIPPLSFFQNWLLLPRVHKYNYL